MVATKYQSAQMWASRHSTRGSSLKCTSRCSSRTEIVCSEALPEFRRRTTRRPSSRPRAMIHLKCLCDLTSSYRCVKTMRCNFFSLLKDTARPFFWTKYRQRRPRFCTLESRKFSVRAKPRVDFRHGAALAVDELVASLCMVHTLTHSPRGNFAVENINSRHSPPLNCCFRNVLQRQRVLAATVDSVDFLEMFCSVKVPRNI